MNKKVRIILIDDAKVFFDELEQKVISQKNIGIENSFEIQLYNSILNKIEFMKQDPF